MSVRTELGDFSSIVCFKAAITGMEDALGEKAAAIAMISAGRARGRKLAGDLGLSGMGVSLDEVTQKVSQALGKEGTRLCLVDQITQEADVFRVRIRESICTSGELEGADRQCTYTLGAIQGVLEEIYRKRLQGKHVESVLKGDSADVLEFKVLADL